MTRIKTAEYIKPANAEGGFYVQVADIEDRALATATQMAEAKALQHGYDVNGRRTTGIPVWHGATYTQSFWFHQRG